jgi:hypothetical protein
MSLKERVNEMKREIETSLIPAKPKNKIGRPSKSDEWLTPEGLAKVTTWAENGLIGKQISHNMGIAHGTLCEWQNTFPELAEAIKRGRKVKDLEVENSLLQRATGYQYEEDVYEPDEDGNLVVVKRVLKSQAPDVTAQIFWLKNRNPSEWRDKVEIQNEHSGTIKIDMGEMEKWSN